MMRTGWWNVIFTITLDGEEVSFEDLGESTQEYILTLIREDYTNGEVFDEDKSGWWSVEFETTLEGEDIRFDELSDVSIEHILEQIGEGYTNGEIIEED